MKYNYLEISVSPTHEEEEREKAYNEKALETQQGCLLED